MSEQLPTPILPVGEEQWLNDCHDPEIAAAAALMGITNPHLINKAYSIGEGPYDGYEKAMEFLSKHKSDDLST